MADTHDTVDTPDQVDGSRIGSTSNPRARYWIFTWNNYTEENVIEMTNFCDKECVEYNFQREIGKEGTPHLQGFWHFKNPRHFNALKKTFPVIHLEKAKNIAAAREYCRKEETRVGDTISGGSRVPKDPLNGLTLKDWQKELIEIINSDPDNRSIYWYYDEHGNCGKTTLAKHLCIRHPDEILYLSGGPAACKYGITTFLYNKVKGKLVRNDKILRAAIFDYTRSQDDRVSYQALEEVKNGIFFNTKYESMQVLFDCPHVVVFANFMPELERLSQDRWKIVNISASEIFGEL